MCGNLGMARAMKASTVGWLEENRRETDEGP